MLREGEKMFGRIRSPHCIVCYQKENDCDLQQSGDELLLSNPQSAMIQSEKSKYNISTTSPVSPSHPPTPPFSASLSTIAPRTLHRRHEDHSRPE